MTQHEARTCEEKNSPAVSDEILAQAQELSRGAEILPEGALGLAKKIEAVRKEGRVLRVKLGIDPTSTDLHIGHAVVFRKLRRFQEFGHQVVLIIGGFTATIGDPTGRSKTRPPLTLEQVNENAKTYLNQMSLVLDLEKTELRNNAEWLSPLNLEEIIRLASNATVSQLLAKEAFANRLANDEPLSFHELFYPLLQGYDSVAIRADVELGGTDQRFNILQGRELQPHYGQDQQVALFVPLLEGTDGKQKMSKTYGNYIALKDEPLEMFGKCMSIPDEMIVKYFELATTYTGAQVDEVKASLQAGANPMESKRSLGVAITSLYHGLEKAEFARDEWQRIFSAKQQPTEIQEYRLDESKPLFRILSESGLAASNSKAKSLVEGGGVQLDGNKITDPNFTIEAKAGLSLVLKAGRQFIRLTH